MGVVGLLKFSCNLLRSLEFDVEAEKIENHYENLSMQ